MIVCWRSVASDEDQSSGAPGVLVMPVGGVVGVVKMRDMTLGRGDWARLGD